MGTFSFLLAMMGPMLSNKGPAKGRGESDYTVATVLKRSCEALYSVAHGEPGSDNCARTCVCFKVASSCLTCRSKYALVPSSYYKGWVVNCPRLSDGGHSFREAMQAADVPKWIFRDSGNSDDPSSASESSSRTWTAAQILTPILVALTLCLAFALFYLHKTGRLSRLKSSLPFMRHSHHNLRPRAWTIGDDVPSRRISRSNSDAEATPMIHPPFRWPSLSPPHRDNTADPHRINNRARTGILTPAFSNAVRSIQRLLGVGPIRVSHGPVPEAFDLEQDCDVETEHPLDALRNNSSRIWRSGLSSLGRSSASTTDLVPSRSNPPSESSAALDTEFDNSRGHDRDVTDIFGDSGPDHHDIGTGEDGGVMLISRDGDDFDLAGSVISVPVGNSPTEADRRSMEVIPPTPTASHKLFRKGSRYHARSASTPHLPYPFPDLSMTRTLSPSTHDLSNPHLYPRPPIPLASPRPILARRAGPINLQPLREGTPGAHYYTAAAPPVKAPSVVSFSPPVPMRSRRKAAATEYSPPLSPHLQDYAPTFPGRSRPGSPYILPGSVPSSPILAEDPQNLIPSAVRGAGYNPFQHARSMSELE